MKKHYAVMGRYRDGMTVGLTTGKTTKAEALKLFKEHANHGLTPKQVREHPIKVEWVASSDSPLTLR